MSATEERICSTVDCGKVANLQCPTCLKLKIEGSFFCSKDCFTKSWAVHKAAHKDAQKTVPADSRTYDPFSTFQYTGPLRAVYPLSPKREVPRAIKRPDYAEGGIPVSEQKVRMSTKIEVLSPEGIEAMRRVCKIAREVLDIGAEAIRVGITTDEIVMLHVRIGDDLGVMCFWVGPAREFSFDLRMLSDTTVKEFICHGIPDKRPLSDGDIVNLDITCYLDGYHGDVNATYLVGNVDETSRRLVNNARECLEKAIATIKPEMRFRDIGKVIEPHARSEGFSTVRTFCGHGINSLFHCAPNVPHYAKNKAFGICKPGMTFTIEPMICEGVWQDRLWPDKWTAATADGKRSAQFEHTLLVTETGVEILTGPAF